LELLENIFLFHYVPAIVALQQKRFIIVDVELGLHRFVTVAYAGRVCTFDNILDCFRQFDFLFSHYLIAADYIDGCVRSKQCDLVKFLRVQLSSLDFNYVLSLEPFARHVDRDGDSSHLSACYSQDSCNIQGVSSGNVINNCSIFDFGYVEFSVTHVKSSLKKGYVQDKDKRL